MRDDRLISVRASQLDRFQRFGQRSDLIELDENRVGYVFADSSRQPLRAGDEKIIANELQAVTKSGRQLRPPIPVVFGKTVFNGNDRILLQP